MFRNYLKLAFRNLTRQKAFSVINITGLAVGLASSLTILLWVQDELNYDRYHEKADRTYRITAAASGLSVVISPVPLGPALQEITPDIVASTRIWREGGVMLQKDNIKFDETKVYYAEPSLFDIFDFKLLYGDKKTALKEIKSVIVSEAVAIKYFGTTDCLGKALVKGANEEFIVSGVLANSKDHSHLDMDVIFSWAHLATWSDNVKNNIWDNFDVYTYIGFNTPKDEAYLNSFNKKIDELFFQHDKTLAVKFSVQPVTDIHLHSKHMAEMPGNGSYQYVAALTVIAGFIVLIGCINFMNLSTARSARRAKEVGLRKVAGAARTQLIRQFLGESVIITLLSLVLALIAVALVLPVVNNLVGKQLHLDFTDPLLLLIIAGISIVTGLLAGGYPAFVLSGFTPAKVLKKDVKGGTGGSIFRNALVISQFVISIVLLVGTTVVYQQLEFIRSKDLGYNKENLLYVNIHGWDKERTVKWRSAFMAHPETANAAFSNDLPANLVSGTVNIQWPGKDPAQQTMFANLFIDDNFIPVYNMELVAGRNFNYELRGDTANFIVNEAGARAMGFTPESAVGQKITMWDRPGEIVGVLKDFNFKPLRESVEPMIIKPNTWGNTITIKAEAGKVEETIKVMREVWTQVDPVYPFSFNFLDKDLENLYKSEQQVGTLFTAFSILAILISCLGLYGLSAYIAEQRTREIGIRKALGASIFSIVYLLNTRFVVPVLVAMVISAPLAYYAMDRWLQDFAYKISFNWFLVAGAGLLALLISLITVSYESVKAAKVNPVKSLRTE